MGGCASKPATKHDAPATGAVAQEAVPARRATKEQKEAVTGATEQAKDAVQQAGEEVQVQVRELERMQKEIQRLKEQPVSAAQEAENNNKIAQLEREVLEVRQHIDTTLEIAEHEVKQAVLTAQASLREQNGQKYDSQGHSQDPTLARGNGASIASDDTLSEGPYGHATSDDRIPAGYGTGQLPESNGHGLSNGHTGYSIPITGSTASEVIPLSPETAGRISNVAAGSTFGGQSDSSSTLSGSTQRTAASTIPRLSSTPILGGPGTVQVQPLAFPGAGQRSSNERSQHASHAQEASSQVAEPTAAEAGAGSGQGSGAGLAGERSLRSIYSLESPRAGSQGAAAAAEEEEQGQAEDLVSDVHARAQQASQEALLAGQAQQQRAHDAAAAIKASHPHGSSASPASTFGSHASSAAVSRIPTGASASGSLAAAPGHAANASSTSLGSPQLTPAAHPPSSLGSNLSGPSGVMADDGGNEIMARVQQAQREAMSAAEESMRQSRKGLLEVKAAIQQHQASGGRYL